MTENLDLFQAPRVYSADASGMIEIPCISLWQPYASLVVAGLKTLETRTWQTKFRGRLLVHASKTVDVEALAAVLEMMTPAARAALARAGVDLEGPTGCALGVVTVTGCRALLPEDKPAAWFYAPGRWAYELTEQRVIKPYPMRGFQKIWRTKVPASALEARVA